MKHLKDIREKYPDIENTTSKEVINQLIRVVREQTGHIISKYHLLYDKNTGTLSRFLDLSPAIEYNGLPTHVAPGPYYERNVGAHMLQGVRLLIKDAYLTLEVVVPRSYWHTHNPYNRWRDMNAFLAGLADLKIKCPIDLTDPKLGAKVISTTYSELSPTDLYARFSDFGRPVAVINAMLRDLGAEPLKQDVTNPLLAKIQNIHENASYVCRLTERKISEIYNEGDCGEHGSCMNKKPTGFFELYDYLQREGRLGLIELNNAAGVRYGRALLWYGTNPDEKYLDRIYCPFPNGHRCPDATDAFKVFCQTHGITKSVWNDQPATLGLEYKSRVFIPVGKDHDYFDHFPYVDSMADWFSDNSLGNDGAARKSGAYSLGCMQNTDGTSDFGGSEEEDDDDRVEMYDGDMMDRDDAYYVDRHGEYYYGHQVVTAMDSDNLELRDECVELNSDHYGHDAFVHKDDATETHDGTYVRDRHAVLLHDGTHAHTDDAVLLDGDWYLKDDDENVIETNGVYSLRTEDEEEPENPIQLSA